MKQIKSQAQQLPQQPLSSFDILPMSTLELERYIRELAQENPVVDLESVSAGEELPWDRDLLRRLQWLEDNDHQNRYYQNPEDEDYDPLSRAPSAGGLEETLSNFLFRQIQRRKLPPPTAELVRYLSVCLDDDGYFRMSVEELSHALNVPVQQLEQALSILRTLEPAGVGASSLSECLQLQLQRFGYDDGPALEIVRSHLSQLGSADHQQLARSLSVSIEEVEDAILLIRELEPKPGAIFTSTEIVPYVQPDVFVEEADGRFLAQGKAERPPLFRISGYYREMYDTTADPEVKAYLSGKLEQAETVLADISRREQLVTLCAQVIADREGEFFRSGPQSLVPLSLSELAQQLSLPEIEVADALREKYLQCARGIFPLRYFFPSLL